MTKNNNLIKLGDAISQIFKEEKLDEKYSIFAIRNETAYAKETIIEKVNKFVGKRLIKELVLK